MRPTLILPILSASEFLIALTSDWPCVRPPGHFCACRDQLEVFSSTKMTLGRLVFASVVPNCRAYDPTFSYEIAVVLLNFVKERPEAAELLRDRTFARRLQ